MLRANLVADSEPGYGSFSKGEESVTRNVLIFDPETGHARWLLPDMTGVISRGYVVWKDGQRAEIGYEGDTDNADNAQPLVVIYMMGVTDLNGDQKVDNSDAHSIALCDPEGTRLRVVLNGVSRINETGLRSDGKVRIVYTAGSKLRQALFDPATFAKIDDREIDIESAIG